MDDKQMREQFDTGINKIKHEIKSRLVHHGLYGSVTDSDTASPDHGLAGSKIEIIVKGRSAVRSFDREQIEDCCLRVRGTVLVGIIAMVDEVAA